MGCRAAAAVRRAVQSAGTSAAEEDVAAKIDEIFAIQSEQKAELDRNEYARGIKITDAQMRMLDISRAEFHGDWNHTIHPQPTLAL